MVASISLRANVITPVNEKLYHTSNLLGQWDGKLPNGQKFTFKVFNIINGNAQIEYDHNGQIQRGVASVAKNIITFGSAQIATKDGKSGVFLFQAGTYSANATITKSAATATPG